jgi:hypothetical protein
MQPIRSAGTRTFKLIHSATSSDAFCHHVMPDSTFTFRSRTPGVRHFLRCQLCCAVKALVRPTCFEVRARELRALIGIEDVRLAVTGQSIHAHLAETTRPRRVSHASWEYKRLSSPTLGPAA